MATKNPSLCASLHPLTRDVLGVFAKELGVPVSKCVYDAVVAQIGEELVEVPEGLRTERAQRWHVPPGLKLAITADAERKRVSVSHWVSSAITRWVSARMPPRGAIAAERARRAALAHA